ncbi:hydroxysqualene dehydroxylase HpnE [Curvibacter delicatus]|uniref:hydroxysqualene dehydroxylase HpnE n=1 Tax=Curvibacter delicatus TaxID=80879 RepID=UPI00082DC696|nr:hydroxysqualene dehydroxylase HpnE [Curvibacter delicatus]
MKLAVIGAGWAGMAAAVQATRDGHRVTVFEAARTLGGRARAVPGTLPDGRKVTLDNGQHILIGAYTDSLRLMRLVGVDPDVALLRLPLTLRFPDGAGLQLPHTRLLPTPLDAFVGIARARGWPLGARGSLLREALRWQMTGFQCGPALSVAQLCERLALPVRQELIEPLCVSALNTPAEQASAQVFLRVLQDALFGVPGGSHLLLPRQDLSAIFPTAAASWLQQHGGTVQAGTRVMQLRAAGTHWQLDGQPFDAVLLAASASESARLLMEYAPDAPDSIANSLTTWTATAQALRYEAITTVYAWGNGASLPAPMLALRSSVAAPAQFVFDRGQLGGPAGLLAFVVSASDTEREVLQAQVLAQAGTQLGLALQPVQTVVEKRATFACTPGLQRPPPTIAPGLLACGDYVAGPYPATLEGAVRSGLQAASCLQHSKG